MNFCASFLSDTGIQKQTNQDALTLIRIRSAPEEMLLAVLCDGVGGMKSGEQASAAVCSAFRDWFHEKAPLLCAMDDPMSTIFSDWEQLVQALHLDLKKTSESAGFRMGTTVEALLLLHDKYYICHVGDCRVYALDETLTQLTHDHSVVQREIDEGRLTPKQAQSDLRQNLLLQCIGSGSSVQPDFLCGAIQPQQRFLICCDGFRRRVSDAEISTACKNASPHERSLKSALCSVTDLCKKRREPDNISSILIHVNPDKPQLIERLCSMLERGKHRSGFRVKQDVLEQHSQR